MALGQCLKGNLGQEVLWPRSGRMFLAKKGTPGKQSSSVTEGHSLLRLHYWQKQKHINIKIKNLTLPWPQRHVQLERAFDSQRGWSVCWKWSIIKDFENEVRTFGKIIKTSRKKSEHYENTVATFWEKVIDILEKPWTSEQTCNIILVCLSDCGGSEVKQRITCLGIVGFI